MDSGEMFEAVLLEKRDVKCEKCQSGTTATQTMEVLSR